MKWPIFIILGLVVASSFALNLHAQVMGGFSNSSADWDEVVEHTLLGEQEGKELWNTLQAKETVCGDLSDEQFGALGEYFMGQMAVDSHAAMNAMMIQTHGEDGEKQIHIIMGKRLSGCDTAAVFPVGSGGMMMNMMTGGWSSPMGNNTTNNMMDFGFTPFGSLGWIFMILWWALIIAGIVALIKWLTSQSRSTNGHGKSALDILEERYAKGEIDKKEFEEKKKDLL